ncbi:leader peptidase (prepilin peptidase) / N-methyltransferase [Thiothrix caldifontis]|uniref:Prepilin leader peptidase/N-methyltransferase n=1 Tax=Thiothrix caldifontis TaxID=525918 RepID=A0A1H4BHB5_9GAMM|nr:A24 family peptidase [Thiothrix caldifontis]SEA47531.1 leader peptidase (prepilin peptidase) / N-methyltransferase [Thiothrix caldifontis]
MELIYLLSTNQVWLISVVGLFSLLVGSFLNVVIYRLPIMLEREWKRDCNEWLDKPYDKLDTGDFNLVVPRSQCPTCGHKITAIENIPLLSYLFLKGKCAGCKTPISMQYPLVELATAVFSMLVAWRVGYGMELIALLGFTWVLVTLFMIDAKTMLLPDILTYPLLWAGLLLNINGTFVSLPDAVLGAAFGYLALWSVFHLFRLLTGKEGMGHGDFKLLAALGAWGGWQILPFVIFASSAFGALFGILWMVAKRNRESLPMPFGPWLAMAGFVAVVWRAEILDGMSKIFMPF